MLGGWLRDDRLSGVVPWEWMEDRLRNPVIWQTWRGPSEFLLDKLYELSHGYHRDPWQDQPSYVEVWCEKDALSGIFKSVLSEYYVTLRIGRGYDSWSSIKEAADEYTRRLKRHGQETTVLYFGDFDPSGEDMHRSLIERFGMLSVYPEVPKIALTHEDTRRLPANFTKADDSRREAFIRKYGDVAVELDALPVEELRERIRTSVEAAMDMLVLEESLRLQREHRRRIRELAEGLDLEQRLEEE